MKKSKRESKLEDLQEKYCVWVWKFEIINDSNESQALSLKDKSRVGIIVDYSRDNTVVNCV